MTRILNIALLALGCLSVTPAMAQDGPSNIYDEAFPEADSSTPTPIHLIGGAAQAYGGGAILHDRAAKERLGNRARLSELQKHQFAQKQKLRLLGGVALISDGGLRLLTILNGRNPSFSPVITQSSTAVKRLVAPAAEAPAKTTSMSVE